MANVNTDTLRSDIKADAVSRVTLMAADTDALTWQDLSPHDRAALAALVVDRAMLIDAIDDACAFLEDRMDVVDGDDGQPRPDAFMSLFMQLDEVRAKARGERWPR